MQAHGPKQAIGSGKAGVGMNQEGGTLHEGPQVDVHVPLLVCQVPAHTAWCPRSRLSSRKRNSSTHHLFSRKYKSCIGSSLWVEVSSEGGGGRGEGEGCLHEQIVDAPGSEGW